MDNNNGKIELALGSWLAALLVGTVAGSMLWVLGGWSFLQGAFVGLIVFVVVGAVISWAMMRPLPAPNELELGIAPSPGKAAPDTKAAPVKAAPVKAAPIKVAPAPTVPKVKPSKALAGEEELAARKGDWRYGAEEAPAKPAKKKKAAAKKAAEPADDSDARPAHLTDAPAGSADDLKKISGVGPKLEETLNSLGIWHYEQVAKLTKDDIAWVDQRLRFKGRIERDDWIGQAKKLAEDKG